jgi:hypothetical protein
MTIIQQVPKAIFLDIEGVVVTHRSVLFSHTKTDHYHGARNREWYKFIDPLAMGLIYRLARDYGAQIVLTSTLRNDEFVMEGLHKVAPPWLPEGTADQFFAAEVTSKLDSREAEIQAYIKKHGVERYVVFDDRELSMGDHFIQINQYDGITMQDFNDGKILLLNEGEQSIQEHIYL